MAILLVDIGNSRVKHATLRQGELQQIEAHALDKVNVQQSFDTSFSALNAISQVYVSNVAGDVVANMFITDCKARWNIVPEFAKSLPEFNGLVNAYDNLNSNAEQLGVDRWLAMIAVNDRIAQPYCVIHCGTAIVIDAVDGESRHLGGLILPGLTTMRLAINANAETIEINELTAAPAFFAQTTHNAVSAGIQYSVAALIEKACVQLQQHTGEQVICMLSGGDAQFIKDNLTQFCSVEPALVLKGLVTYFGLTACV